MRMRADTLDILELCAGHRCQTVRDFLDVRAVDVQVVVEQKVIDLADRACGCVLDRHNADIGLAVADGLENLLPGGHVMWLTAREQCTRGQLLIRTRDPLIEHGFRLDKRLIWLKRELFRRLTENFAVLILAAGADHALQQRNVFELELLLHAGGALLNDFRFAVRLVDFVVRLGLGLCDLERQRHTQQEQLSDSGVNAVDILTDFGKFTHDNPSPPSEDLPVQRRRRLRPPARRG